MSPVNDLADVLLRVETHPASPERCRCSLSVMSKLKNPRAKKAASLSHDRRNVYGENSKASRKNIPRAKARTHRQHRRAVHQAISDTDELSSDSGLEYAEKAVAEAARDVKLHGFRKQPDVALGEYLARKHKRPRA